MEVVWFCLLAWVLATYVVLDGFDFGVGMLHLFVAKNEAERKQVIRSVGPVWDGNEVWLLAAGGTMFLAFPKLLAVSFSGFYLPLMIVLWLLIFRALGIELRHQLEDPLWTQFWDFAFAAASFLLAVCLGAALGNVVRGVPINSEGVFFEPLWTDFRVRQETGILDWYTVLVGVTAVLALAHHGALWLGARTDGEVKRRSDRIVRGLWPLVCVATVAVALVSAVVQPNVRESLSARPWGVGFMGLAVLGLIGAYRWAKGAQTMRAFLASCVYLYGLLGSVAVAVYPFVLPARDPALGLTAKAAAAGETGLVVGLMWWIPGVLVACGYFVYLYSTMPARFSVNDPADH